MRIMNLRSCLSGATIGHSRCLEEFSGTHAYHTQPGPIMSKVSAFLSPPNQHPLSRVATLLAVGALGVAAPLACFAQAASHPSSLAPRPVNPSANIGTTTTVQNPGVVSWVHIGDLHITDGAQQNYADFQTIIKNVNQYLLNGVNFAVLPGDNANEGSEAEYQIIKQATDQLRVPLYAVPGDHDLRNGLGLFTKYLEPVPYQSFSADRYHFVFMDALDASASGGFGIGQEQLAWLSNDLAQASQRGLQSVLFMHAFPSKVGGSAQAIQDLITKNRVLMVDVGHTHYNQVDNDGHTIYAATRSTGQVTEGPVGFSLANLDNGVVSWKFKPLGQWPFVMITSPSDKQLITDATKANQVIRGTVDVRAKVWDDKGVSSATYDVDNGTPQPLTRIGSTQMWSAKWNSTQVADGNHQITVHVQGAGGNTNDDKIYVVVSQAGTYQTPQRSVGDNGNSIGTYAEKGLLGTQGGGGGKGGPGRPGGPGGKGPRGPKGAPGASAAPGAPAVPTTVPAGGSHS